MIQVRVPFELKNPYLNIFKEYEKRLHWKFSFLHKKSENLLDNINKKDFLIALDIWGEKLTSVAFANLLNIKLPLYKNIIFLIGGDQGIDKNILSHVNFKISFGNNTWPHQLCAVMLIEQIYRAETIINHHPYHK